MFSGGVLLIMCVLMREVHAYNTYVSLFPVMCVLMCGCLYTVLLYRFVNPSVCGSYTYVHCSLIDVFITHCEHFICTYVRRNICGVIPV